MRLRIRLQPRSSPVDPRMAVSQIDGVVVAPGANLPTCNTEQPAPRRAWTSPELVMHESFTVLTQHFFGPAGALLALQVTCSVVNGQLICH